MKRSLFIALAVGLGLTANLWAQVPSYVPANGLVGYWPFNGNANDESGNGNNGNLYNGVSQTSDRNGNPSSAFNFDGIDDYVSANIIGDLNKVTISLWYNPSYPINYYPLLIGINDIRFIEMAGNYPFWVANNTVGHLGSYPDGLPSLPCIPDFDQWHFVVIIYDYDLNQHKIYIDNTLCSSGNTSSSLSIQNGNMIIGNTSSSIYGYVGKMDDLAIWNRALSECEIQDLYNSQLNSTSGSIIISPQTTSITSNVSLSTTTNSTNIQWQTNGVNLGWQNVPSNSTYSGGTTNTLTVNNVQLANHNQPFRVIASSGNCTDTSNIATIQIADTCITKVTVYDTLLTTVTDTLIINTTLSLPSPNNENTIKIYPNPANDHITIDNGNFSAMAGYSIKITNNAGQQVFQNSINQAQFNVDLSTWSGNGLYFVHLIDSQNNTVTIRKIVLQ